MNMSQSYFPKYLMCSLIGNFFFLHFLERVPHKNVIKIITDKIYVYCELYDIK